MQEAVLMMIPEAWQKKKTLSGRVIIRWPPGGRMEGSVVDASRRRELRQYVGLVHVAHARSDKEVGYRRRRAFFMA